MLDDENSNGTPESSGDNGRPSDAALRHECEELRRKVEKLQTQNIVLSKALSKFLCEEIEIDKEVLLSGIGKEPPIEDLIAEIRQTGSR